MTTTDVFRFEFEKSVPLSDAEMTLQLSMIAVEGLVGPSRVRLDATYHVDEPHNAIFVDGTTFVGAALVCVFTGILIREFGEAAFGVRRVAMAPTPPGRVA